MDEENHKKYSMATQIGETRNKNGNLLRGCQEGRKHSKERNMTTK